MTQYCNFCLCILGTELIIQYDHLRFFYHRPGNRRTLFLTAREGDSPLTDEGFKSLFKLQYIVSDLSDFGSLFNILLCGFFSAKRDVLTDRGGEEERLLRHISNDLAQGLKIPLLQVNSVDDHLSLIGIKTARYWIDQGCLTRSGPPYKCCRGACFNYKINIFQHILFSSWITEGYIPELDLSLNRVGHPAVGMIFNFQGGSQQRINSLPRSQCLLKTVNGIAHRGDPPGQIPHNDYKFCNIPDRQLPLHHLFPLLLFSIKN